MERDRKWWRKRAGATCSKGRRLESNQRLCGLVHQLLLTLRSGYKFKQSVQVCVSTNTQVCTRCILIQRPSLRTHLIVLVPGQRLGGEDKPVLLGSSLHDADVVNGQPALPDHLRNRRGQTIRKRQKAHPRPPHIHFPHIYQLLCSTHVPTQR